MGSRSWGGGGWESAPASMRYTAIRGACRVPAGRAGNADHRRMQRLSTPPVSGPDVGPARDQVSSHLGVVAEPRSMQRGVAFVDRGETLGEEELVASRQPGRR